MLSWESWFDTEILGSGDVAAGVSVAGQASETFAAAGAVATPSISITGSGAQTFAGVGNVSVGVAISGGAGTKVVGHASGVGAGVYGHADNAAILAALNAQQIGRRKKADEIYAAALARNTAILQARKEAHRQLEEEWLLGLITTDEFIAA